MSNLERDTLQAQIDGLKEQVQKLTAQLEAIGQEESVESLVARLMNEREARTC